MPAITEREKRLIRYSSIGVAVYLILFFVWKPLQSRKKSYDQLLGNAQALKFRIEPYESRAESVEQLMKKFQMDPAKLSDASVVGEASAAIQKAAMSSGIAVGPVRESPSHSSSQELGSVQFEGTGPVPAVMGLLKRMESLGYPLIIDSVQLTPETMRPGQVKLNLTVVILDFEQWKNEDKPNA